jgi:hypothetical protein
MKIISALVFIYLIMAFIANDFNLLNWHWVIRLIYVVWSLLVFAKK